MFEFPPFGFGVWYDRHTGRRWCWSERNPTELERSYRAAGDPVAADEDDITDGWNHLSRQHALRSLRAELRRRGERDAQREDAAELAAASDVDTELGEDDEHDAAQDEPG